MLIAGSVRAERLWRRGSTAGLSSPAFKWSGGSVLSSGIGEMAKERGEKLSGVFVVRLRVRNREPRCCCGLATAAARWRPLGLVGVAWRSGEGTSARKEGGEEHQCDAWRLAGRRWRWGGGSERRESAALPTVRESREAGRGRRNWIYLQIPKIPGTQI